MIDKIISSEPTLVQTNPVPALNNQKKFDDFYLQSLVKNDDIKQHFEKDNSLFGQQNFQAVPHLCQQQTEHGNTQAVSAHTMSKCPLLPEQTVLPGNPSVKEFVQTVLPYAEQAARLSGIDPCLLLAQAALETGWGRHMVRDSQGNSSNNLFNIKASKNRNEPSVLVKTTEFTDASPVKMKAAFKSYPSLANSFEDYLSLIINNPRYKLAVAQAESPTLYVRALQEAGYATDPHYAEKVLAIYQSSDLQEALQAVF